MTPEPGRVRRQDEGLEPALLFFDDPDEQQQLLLSSLDKLYEDGFKGKDIVILSPRRDAVCAGRGHRRAALEG
ncbi:MAG: hypothetical protein ACYCXU_02100 [Thermoleophilia bacterium]